jgi:hypothetical protein
LRRPRSRSELVGYVLLGLAALIALVFALAVLTYGFGQRL